MVPTGNRASNVVLFGFNRPSLTERVMAEIRGYRPSKLFFFVDGPRDSVPADHELVHKTQSLTSHVDWDCELQVHFSPTNQGAGAHISNGLDLVFDQVQHAIILEDDCLPHPSFFDYMDELLHKYQSDPRIMSVGGHLWHLPDSDSGESYTFSRYPATWGWGTWADRWKLFDLRISKWGRQRETSWLEEIIGQDPIALAYWYRIFDSVEVRSDIWDYQWTHAVWTHQGLTIRPTRNLVHNIGFGPDASHTFDPTHPAGTRIARGVQLPLQHPRGVSVDPMSEKIIEDTTYSGMLGRQIRIGRDRIHSRLRPS